MLLQTSQRGSAEQQVVCRDMMHAHECTVHKDYPPDAKKQAQKSTSKLRRRDSDLNRLLQQTHSAVVAKQLQGSFAQTN